MPDDSTLAFLLTHELQNAFQTWDKNQPARTGLHASSVLESDSDFCTRQHVLAEIFPSERQQKEQFWKVLAMFANGWSIHKKWQEDILKPTDMVVPVGWNDDFYSKMVYELDLTHIDETTGIHFSPDAIIQFAGQTMPVEIKGINHEDFAGVEELYRSVVKSLAFDVRSVSYEKAQESRPGLVGATLIEAMARNKSIRSAVPQLNLYLHLLGLQKGIILAEDKNTQDFMLWVWTYDPKLVEPQLVKAEKVKKAIKVYAPVKNNLPKRICKTVNDSRAKRCPFRDACFKEGR